MKRKWLIIVVALVVVLFFVLLGVEGALRVTDYRTRGIWTVDANVGSTYLPGIVGRWTGQGEGEVRISAQGLRDHFYSVEKPAKVWRVIVLGDSIMAGLRTKLALTFSKQLEKRLQADGYRAEVINFGVTDFSTAQDLIYLQTKAIKFHPDLVILAFSAGQDYRRNLRAWLRDDRRPYFRVDRDGRLVLDNSFRRTRSFRFRTSWLGRMLYWFKANSRLANYINDRINRRQTRRRGLTAKRPERAGPRPSIYAPDRFPMVKKAYDLTAKIVAALARWCAEHQIALVVMIIPAAAQVHLDERRPLAKAHPDWKLDEPTDFMVGVCRRDSLVCLDLTGPFRAENLKSSQQFNGPGQRADIRWTAHAHQRAAELMVKFLVDKKLIPERYHQ